MTENNYMKTRTFLTLTGILVTVLIVIFGYVFTSVSAVRGEVDSYQKDTTEIKSRLTGIETNIIWIKQALK